MRTIGYKLPLDAINPAHGSTLRVNSLSHEIFSRILLQIDAVSRSVWKVNPQESVRFDEVVKPFVTAWWWSGESLVSGCRS